MVYKILSVTLLLGCASYAADNDGVSGIVRDTNLGAWSPQENVMSRDRTDRCENGANAIYDALKMAGLDHFDTDSCMNEIRDYLRDLRSEPDYQRKYARSNLLNRNKVDDALQGFARISGLATGGYWANEFRGEIDGRQYTLRDVLAMVWTVYKNFEVFYYGSDLEKERENLKLAILSNMAEFLEDDGHMVCDVGVSARVVNMLQGYLAGVNITADVDIYAANTNANAGIATVTPLQFIDYANGRLTGLMQSNTILSSYLVHFAFPSEKMKTSVINKMREIRQSWIDGFSRKYPNEASKLGSLTKIFDEIIRPMESANNVNTTDADLVRDFGAYNAGDFADLFYTDDNTQGATSSTTQSSSNPQTSVLLSASLLQAQSSPYSQPLQSSLTTQNRSSLSSNSNSGLTSSYAPQPSTSYHHAQQQSSPYSQPLQSSLTTQNLGSFGSSFNSGLTSSYAPQPSTSYHQAPQPTYGLGYGGSPSNYYAQPQQYHWAPQPQPSVVVAPQPQPQAPVIVAPQPQPQPPVVVAPQPQPQAPVVVAPQPQPQPQIGDKKTINGKLHKFTAKGWERL